jgi:uncharacterized protein YeaO (DUF488 family)
MVRASTSIANDLPQSAWENPAPRDTLPFPVPTRIKRIYEPPDPGDGYRVLVDHIWPRGISIEHAKLDAWVRELAPSDELRRWYDHDPERFGEFARRYRAELDAQRPLLTDLRRRARSGTVTLVFAARDTEHSNAAVLGDVLRRGRR